MSNKPQPAPQMTSVVQMNAYIDFWSNTCKTISANKTLLSDEKKEYLFKQLATMKDAKLHDIIMDLFSWGEEDEVMLQTFMALSLEVMKRSTPSKFKEAQRIIEIRHLSGDKTVTDVTPLIKQE
jgi:hypothetical protein